MPQLSPCGTSVISIDISHEHGDSSGRSTLALASEALARLNDRQIVATLALDGAVDSDWLEAEGENLAGHELAILADSNWYSVSNHRGQFAQGLSRHVQQARATGYGPTTLALPAGRLPEHLDLLVKHGISAVRTVRSGSVRSRWSWGRGKRETPARDVQPQSLRWGLWEFGRPLALVEQGVRRITREIAAAAADAGLVQISVDLAPLAGQGSSGWRQFDQVLERLAQQHQQQTIEPMTLASVVAALTRTRHAPSAHSILRPAA